MAHGTMAPVAQTITTGYTFSDKVNENDLPIWLHDIYKIHQDTVSRDKMLLGILNVTSGLMGGANGSTEEQSGIYGIYDGHRVFAPLLPTYMVLPQQKGRFDFLQAVGPTREKGDASTI